MGSITAYIPKPRFIVGVAISLALLTFIVTMARSNATVNRIRGYLGLSVNQAQIA